MPRVCCMAGIDEDKIAMFAVALTKAGMSIPATSELLDVAALARLRPRLMLCDVDGLAVDPLEMLRRLRFVLPDCIIGVYTGITTRPWAHACHLAGANALFSKSATAAELLLGLRDVLGIGCYTDPRFVAA